MCVLRPVIESNMVIYGLHNGDRRYRYIGLTTRGASHRLNAHWHSVSSGSSLPVHNWMRKYGRDQIHTEVLDTAGGLDILWEKEVFWIQKFRSQDAGLLNLSDGGQGGVNPSAETRLKISESKIGKKRSPELVERMRVLKTGLKASEETRRRMSEAHKGRQVSEETRKKLSQAKLGTKHSEETKQKISDLHKGNTYRLGKNHTEETKRKISEAKKGTSYPVSQETRIKLSIANKGKPPTRGPHIRWHVNQNISKPEACNYCKEQFEQGSN